LRDWSITAAIKDIFEENSSLRKDVIFLRVLLFASGALNVAFILKHLLH
jgi:hypothetical protein